MSNAIPLVVYPIQDLAAAKALYSAVLGVAPYADSPYYVGFRVGEQEVGLAPQGPQAGLSGPLVYCAVSDIHAALQAVQAAGAAVQQDVKDVGGGRLIATFKDAEGNVTGLMQAA